MPFSNQQRMKNVEIKGCGSGEWRRIFEAMKQGQK